MARALKVKLCSRPWSPWSPVSWRSVYPRVHPGSSRTTKTTRRAPPSRGSELRQCPDKAAAEVENIRSKNISFEMLHKFQPKIILLQKTYKIFQRTERQILTKMWFCDVQNNSLVSTTLQQCVWKPFFILVAFFLFQEGSGIYIILFYAVDFVREVGTGAADESVVSIGVGLARLIMSVVGAFLLCKFVYKVLWKIICLISQRTECEVGKQTRWIK